MRALLARVQVVSAFRALSYWLADHGQYRPALCAARHGARTGHIERARPECFVFPKTWRRAWPAALLLITAAHVTVLPVFTV